MIDERTAVQQSQLREQYGADERHRRQLLEVHLHREFVLFLLHHESHLTREPHLESCPRVLWIHAWVSSGSGLPDANANVVQLYVSVRIFRTTVAPRFYTTFSPFLDLLESTSRIRHGPSSARHSTRSSVGLWMFFFTKKKKKKHSSLATHCLSVYQRRYAREVVDSRFDQRQVARQL